MFNEEWDGLKYGTDKRLPLTAAVPQYLRWKIAQLKLCLNDLRYLADKHDLRHAENLYKIMVAEAETELERVSWFIVAKRLEIKEATE